MTERKLLKAARALIARPEDWTQHTPARDARGKKVRAGAPCAVCFCVVGAIARVSDDGLGISAIEVLWKALGLDAAGEHPVVAVGHWNDARDRTHSEVLLGLDRAVAW